MKEHLEEKLAFAQRRVTELEARALAAEAKCAAAETNCAEAREIMLDLLAAIGVRDVCAKCGAAVFWLRTRGHGGARLYNLDGTEHWPCPGGQIPKSDNQEERTNL